MLDREVIKEFMEEGFSECEIEIPDDISKDILVETFCKYIEDDYHEWKNMVTPKIKTKNWQK